MLSLFGLSCVLPGGCELDLLTPPSDGNELPIIQDWADVAVQVLALDRADLALVILAELRLATKTKGPASCGLECVFCFDLSLLGSNMISDP